MDSALCTINNIVYDFASFSGLDEKELSKLRRALVCQKCKAQGYYRKKSRDGKAACFGACHKDDCEYKTEGEASQINPDIVEEVNVIATNNQTIDIVFERYEPNVKQSKVSVNLDIKITSTTSRQYTKSPVQEKNVQKGLSALLKILRYTDSFASSDIKINTGAQHPFKAKNLFINFDDIENHLERLWRGVGIGVSSVTLILRLSGLMLPISRMSVFLFLL